MIGFSKAPRFGGFIFIQSLGILPQMIWSACSNHIYFMYY